MVTLIFAEHFRPLLDQIWKLEEALYNIQFEQHWLEAQTERQAIGLFWIFLCSVLILYGCSCFFAYFLYPTLATFSLS